jgi:PAS domain S-box-containing protein
MPIQRKLTLAFLGTSGTVLFLTCASFTAYEIINLRQGMIDGYTTRSRIIAANSTAALAFQNVADAEEVLGALKTDKRVLEAALYDASGKLFAKYPADAPSGAFPSAPGKTSYQKDYLEIFGPVLQADRVLGTVYLRSDLTALTDRYQAYGWLSFWIVLGSLLFGYLLARALQKQISSPILALAGTAHTVTRQGNFSIRAQKQSEDELGTLTDAFNRMLEEIHSREEALKASESKFRALIENSSDGIAVSDDQGQALYVSPALTRMLDLSEEDFVGRSRRDLVHPEDLDYVLGKMAETLKNPGRIVQARYRLRHKDGSWRWIEMTANNLLANPAVGGIVRNIRDITDQKKAEELLKSRDIFQVSVEAIKDYAVLVLDPKGRILSWNQGAEAIKGYKATEVVGKGMEIFYTPQDRERGHADELLRTAAEKGRVEEEGWRVRKDGSRFLADMALAAVRDPSGALLGFVKVTRDITERKKMEDEIRQSNNFLNSIFENVPNMIFVKDAKDLRFVMFNKAGEDLLGVPRKDLIGKSDRDFFPKEQAEFFIAKDRSVLMDRKLVDIPEEPIDTKDGKRILHTKKFPVYGPDDKPLYLMGISEDITEQKERERLKIYTQALEVSNKELQDFVFVASHDLQEPLRKVQSFGEFLRSEFQEVLGETGRGYVDRMQSAAERMQRLINDLLALTRVTTKAQPFASVDIGTVLKDVLSDLEVRIAEKKSRVEVGFLPKIEADATQMRQLFQNLVGNALKFQRPGVEPVVRVGAKTLEDGKTCRITVEDNGIGFDNKYADQIFKVFERLHGKDEYEGTGIGLAVCRKVVERHGGTIRAEGRPGQGALFIVELPIRHNV